MGVAQVRDCALCLPPPSPLGGRQWVKDIFSSWLNIYSCIEAGETAHRREIKYSCQHLQGEPFDLALPDFPARLYGRVLNMTRLCQKGRICAVSVSSQLGVSKRGAFWDTEASFSCSLHLN